ncbi:hypothetical protein C2845_PM16G17970 [Panicum miliaceum]|uniref:Uncharacterized protein n=1 Tax=Panicum miliaceum TaxID=4540 RepID=A0A3L6PZE9_PANMI|nr:hypothetical protein C2845_PM16G17970 [Panicum miliaceum]
MIFLKNFRLEIWKQASRMYNTVFVIGLNPTPGTVAQRPNRSSAGECGSGALRSARPHAMHTNSHGSFLRRHRPSPRCSGRAKRAREMDAPCVPSGRCFPVSSGDKPDLAHQVSGRGAASGRLACHAGLLAPTPRLRSRRVLLPPAGGPCGLPGPDGVELHLLVAALLAAEGRVPSVHEDVAVAGQGFGAERAGIQRGQPGLAERLGVEEEGASEVCCRHGLGLATCVASC